MRKDLVKMSKDDKNRDYLDQIYYALGNIERSQNNMSKAIEYYGLSAKSSAGNDNQKGVSYLTLPITTLPNQPTKRHKILRQRL